MTIDASRAESLLDACVRLPEHVVSRALSKQSVILSLKSGKYYGVNGTGGRILQTVASAPTLREASAALAQHYERPVDEIERDVVNFCSALLERELLEIRPADAA